MPNKKKKNKPNAFSMYMIDLKTELEEQGVIFKNGLSDVVDIAGPKFKALSAEDKLYYEQLAKERLARDKNDIAQKYTSQGVPLSVVRRIQEEEAESYSKMLREIETTVQSLDRDTTLKDHKFYFIHINYFCYVVESDEYIPSEIALSEFNLQEGLLNTFHTIINPGSIPTGYRYESKKHGESTHQIEFPPEDVELTSFPDLVNHMKDFIGMGMKRQCPPFYAMKNMKDHTTKCLEFICKHAGEHLDLFRVYDIARLFYEIRNKASEGKGAGFPVYSLAEAEIEKDIFNYTLGIGCKYHEDVKSEAIQHCSLSTVRRWGFLIADFTCQDLGIRLIPGQHCPRTADTIGRLDYDREPHYAARAPDMEPHRMESARQDSRPRVAKPRGQTVAATLKSTLKSTAPKSDSGGDEEKLPVRLPRSSATEAILKSARQGATNVAGGSSQGFTWAQAVGGRGLSVASAAQGSSQVVGRGMTHVPFSLAEQPAGRGRGILGQMNNLKLN